MYLYKVNPEYDSYNSDISKNILDSLLKKYKFNQLSFNKSEDINSAITVGTKYSRFYVSEFPGNCAALVLHGIQGIFGAFNIDEVLKFSIELCQKMDYSCLFVTVTNTELRDVLINDYGFILTSSFINAHSGAKNYFLQKFIAENAKPKVIAFYSNEIL